MYSREQAFRDKFEAAAACLGAALHEVVSLKLRDAVGSHEVYHELLHELEHEVGIRSSSIQGNYQGTAYLVEGSKTKVIVVEHETGLEILYIAGSIASLIGLVPMILRGWDALRHGKRHRHPPDVHGIETRRLDQDGHLIEDRCAALDVPWAAPLSVMNTALLSAAEGIDADLNRLKKAMGDLSHRVSALEAATSARCGARKTRG